MIVNMEEEEKNHEKNYRKNKGVGYYSGNYCRHTDNAYRRINDKVGNGRML